MKRMVVAITSYFGKNDDNYISRFTINLCRLETKRHDFVRNYRKDRCQ